MNTLSRRTALQALLGAGPVETDTIDLDRRFQPIDHFGASDCWSFQRLGAWSEEARHRVADLLFSSTKGIALSCWRFNLGAGVNPRITNPWRTAETFELDEGRYDWSRQQPERWFLTAAKARAVPRFLAFVNSPPGRLTRNGLTFCPPDGTTNLKPGAEAGFARYLCDILDHFRTLPVDGGRLEFDYLSPINEPQWDWTGRSQEGMRASNADIKRIALAIHSELRRRRLRTRLSLIESGSIPDLYQLNEKATSKYAAPYGNYLEALAGDPELSPVLNNTLGYHSYWSDRLKGELVEHRQKLAEARKRFPGLKLWQTEYCVMTGPEGKGGNGRDLTMNTALDVARVIHLDLTLAGVSAWHWWTAASPVNYKDGLIYTNWRKPGDEESILPARTLWALGNYSRFVRPGMVRVALNGARHDIQGLLASAYFDPKARTLAAVYLNLSTEPRPIRLAIQGRGLRPKTITPFITSDTPGDELRSAPTASAGAPVEIPPRSVVTLLMR